MDYDDDDDKLGDIFLAKKFLILSVTYYCMMMNSGCFFCSFEMDTNVEVLTKKMSFLF